MTTKTHLLKYKHPDGKVGTFCGIHGVDDGGHEFTRTDNGREGRVEYAEDRKGTDCARCLAAHASQFR